MIEDFIKHIFGGYELFQIMSFIWFFFIGYFIYGLTETSGRNIESKSTPKKWSWKFWYKDNRKRYLTSILCTYVLFRFYTEFVGHPMTDFEALMLGMIGDGIGATAKKRVKLVAGDREKLMKDSEISGVNNNEEGF